MTTTPVTPAAPSWITLLITLGAQLGATFVKNTQVGALITSGVTATTSIITAIQNAKAAGTATAGNLVVPIFIVALQEALLVAVQGNKISASDAAELTKALAAFFLIKINF